MSNLTITANASLPQESETDTFQTRQSSAMSEHSSVKGSPQAIRAWLTSLPPASPANRSALPESEPEPMTSAICGPQLSSASAWYDRDSRSWKTFQVSFLQGISAQSWETWPRAGMMHAGVFYPQLNWERRISEIGCGSLLPTPIDPSRGGGSSRSGDRHSEIPTLHGMARSGMWPTPTVNGNHNRKGASAKSGDGLATAVLATPQARDFRTGSTARWENPERSRNLNDQIGGKLNPTWVEWLMGWPLGWTDLKPLAMDKFRQWLEQHGSCLEVNNEQRTR